MGFLSIAFRRWIQYLPIMTLTFDSWPNKAIEFRGGIQDFGLRGALTRILNKISAVVSKIWRAKRARRKIEVVDDTSPMINWFLWDKNHINIFYFIWISSDLWKIIDVLGIFKGARVACPPPPLNLCTEFINSSHAKFEPSYIKIHLMAWSLLCSQGYIHFCLLWPWPLTSDLIKINRVHLLVMVNMSAKFDKDVQNGLVYGVHKVKVYMYTD